MDLTEISAPRVTKLSSIDSKNQLIMASNGSLVSAGKARRTATRRPAVPAGNTPARMLSLAADRKLIVCSAPDSAESEVNEEQRKEKVAELRRKEKELQDTLAKKVEELKKVCMREAVSLLLPTVLSLVIEGLRSPPAPPHL